MCHLLFLVRLLMNYIGVELCSADSLGLHMEDSILQIANDNHLSIIESLITVLPMLGFSAQPQVEQVDRHGSLFPPTP